MHGLVVEPALSMFQNMYHPTSGLQYCQSHRLALTLRQFEVP